MKMGIVAGIAAAVILAAVSAFAGWEGAQVIDANGGNTADPPDVALDSNGDAIAVFQQGIPAWSRVYANRYVANIGWGTAITIDTATPFVHYWTPQVAVDPDGDAIAVCRDWNGATGHIVGNVYKTDWAWLGPTSPLDPGANSAWGPQISCDAQGNGMAVFYQIPGGPLIQRLYGRRYTPSGGWGPVLGPIDANTGSSVQDPQVALAPSGNGFAVWKQSDGAKDRIYANRYISGSNWTGAFPIDTGGGVDGSSPQIAVNAQGNAVAAYRLWYGGTDYRIYAKRYTSDVWNAPERVDGGGTALSPNNPQVAIDPSGNAIVVFDKKEGAVVRMWATRFDALSGSWSTPEKIDPDSGGDAASPRVAFDGSGNAIAVFDKVDASFFLHVWANRYVADIGWGTAERIDNGTTESRDAAVAVDAQGNAMAAFRQHIGTEFRIYANRYVPPPTPTPTPAPPIDLTVNKNTFSSSDQIAVTANVQAISTPFYPFIRIVMPDGSTLYYAAGQGLTPAVTPYLDGGPFTLATPLANYPIVASSFAGIAAGTYYLEGGAVDATKTTSVSNLVYVGTVDRETLVVQ